MPGGCGLQFTDNLGTAEAKGFDLQAEFAAGPMKFDLATGYTEARYTKDSSLRSPDCPHGSGIPCLPLARAGDAISGQASINLNPGTNAPWTGSLGAEYDFKAGDRPAYVRFDYQFQSRNNWLSNLQDPGHFTVQPPTPTPCARERVRAAARRRDARQLECLRVHRQPVRLAHGDELHEGAGRLLQSAAGPPHEQENQYTFRPRTYGLTATLHL